MPIGGLLLLPDSFHRDDKAASLSSIEGFAGAAGLAAGLAGASLVIYNAILLVFASARITRTFTTCPTFTTSIGSCTYRFAS